MNLFDLVTALADGTDNPIKTSKSIKESQLWNDGTNDWSAGDQWHGGDQGDNWSNVGEGVGPEGLDGGTASPIPGNPGFNEDSLHVGDPIIVVGPNQFEGKTGEISEFSPSGKFVIVNLYNYGEHSMHLSDVEYNEYADRDEDDLDEGEFSIKDAPEINTKILFLKNVNGHEYRLVKQGDIYKIIVDRRPTTRQLFSSFNDAKKAMYQLLLNAVHTGDEGVEESSHKLRSKGLASRRDRFKALREKSVDEARANDINFGHTVGQGSWIVYDPQTKQIKKRFKTHTAGKSYAKTHNLGFASSEFYFDRVKGSEVAEAVGLNRDKVRAALWYEWQQDPNYQDENGRPLEQTPEQMDQDDYDMFEEAVDDVIHYANEVGITNAAMAVVKYNMLQSDIVQRELGGSKGLAESETDYSKRRQRERDIDAGKPVDPEDEDDGETDYSRRRAQQKKELELGEGKYDDVYSDMDDYSRQFYKNKLIRLNAQQKRDAEVDAKFNPKNKDSKKKQQGVAESYWTKLQNEKNTRLNSLVNELKESIEKK